MKQLLHILIALAFVGVYADEPEKLVNGIPTTVEQNPHVVSLRLHNQHICGGSIIDERTILTAAHCVEPYVHDYKQRQSLSVVSGTTLLSRGGIHHRVATLLAHEKYSPNSYSYDIGLIKLAAPIKFNNNTQPIKLPTLDLARGEDLTLVAWGSMGFMRPVHDNLQKLNAKCMLPNECQMYHRSMYIDATEFCTLISSGTGACNGDSGSGVVRNRDKTIVGLVSRGIPCARGIPDVFTNVFKFLGWIHLNS